MQVLIQSIKRTKMKIYLLFFLLGSFLIYSNPGYSVKGKNDQAGEQVTSNNINIVCSPELENLVAAWASSYREERTGHDFVISCNADKPADGSIYFFTSNNPLTRDEAMVDKIVVCHEIIVPVINIKNPMMRKLSSEGMTAGEFSQLLSANETWDQVKDDVENLPLRVYIADYEQLAPKLAGFAGMSESLIFAEKINSSEELLTIIRKDVHAIGFCRLADVLGKEKNDFADGISIIPIDKNRNGQIDGFERIYSSPEELSRGAWIGKYPRKLCCEVFAASTSLPMNQASDDFLEWVIDEGQEPVSSLGFSSLSTREKTAGFLALRPSSPSDFTSSAPDSSAIWVMVAAALAFAFLVIVVVTASFSKRSGIQSEDIAITSALNVNSIKAPAGLFYDKTHTWAFMEQTGLVKLGVDDFLPHVTGKLSQIKMKTPGEKIRKGEKILTLVRDGKQLEIYSPVTGVIKAQNDLLNNNPSQLNTDPYTTGWVYQVEPANWLRETKFMFMASKFRDWLDDEFVRLKDFLAASANANTVVYNHIVLQDGGELTDNVLANLEPKVWEDFQTHFIDVSR